MSDSEIPGNIFAQQSEDHDGNEENVYFLLEYINPKYTREEWVRLVNKHELTAGEAIPLMNGLAPVAWKVYIEDGKGDYFSELTHSIQRSLIIAEAEGFKKGTPAEWLAWGRIHDLDKPILKSNVTLDAPDTCMFILFESAVDDKELETATDNYKEMSKNETEQLAPNKKKETNQGNLFKLESTADIGLQPKKDKTAQSEPEIHTLFDPINKKAITLLFDKVSELSWKKYFYRAARNGLKDIRENKGLYNPSKIADWLVQKGLYTREQVDRKLANNLPERSKDEKNLITGEFV